MSLIEPQIIFRKIQLKYHLELIFSWNQIITSYFYPRVYKWFCYYGCCINLVYQCLFQNYLLRILKLILSGECHTLSLVFDHWKSHFAPPQRWRPDHWLKQQNGPSGASKRQVWCQSKIWSESKPSFLLLLTLTTSVRFSKQHYWTRTTKTANWQNHNNKDSQKPTYFGKSVGEKNSQKLTPKKHTL